MSDRIKDKMTLDHAMDMASEISNDIGPYCERVIIAGSIRRKKDKISDIEMVVIPRYEERVKEVNLFESITEDVDLLDEYIKQSPNFSRRLNKDGNEAYGDKNKLLYYKETTPLDIFTANDKDLVMVLFIRTGSYQNNIKVAVQARKVGYKIEQYEGGYKDLESGQIWTMIDENKVYEFIGLKYLKPEDR